MSVEKDYRNSFVNPEAAAHYDLVAYSPGRYETVLHELEARLLERVLQRLRRHRSQIEYLDFACGTGRITKTLEEGVERAVALDINQPMLDRAAERLERATLVRGDLTADDSLVPGPFDLITTFRFVLNAQPELRETALTRLAARLRDDESVLVFQAHGNPYSLLCLRMLAVRTGLWSSGEPERNHLSVGQCKAIARACNLRVESVRGFGLLSRWLARFLPYRVALGLEGFLARIPLLHLLGVDLVLICRRAT